jgi:hypothetical protein
MRTQGAVALATLVSIMGSDTSGALAQEVHALGLPAQLLQTLAATPATLFSEVIRRHQRTHPSLGGGGGRGLLPGHPKLAGRDRRSRGHAGGSGGGVGWGLGAGGS